MANNAPAVVECAVDYPLGFTFEYSSSSMPSSLVRSGLMPMDAVCYALGHPNLSKGMSLLKDACDAGLLYFSLIKVALPTIFDQSMAKARVGDPEASSCSCCIILFTQHTHARTHIHTQIHVVCNKEHARLNASDRPDGPEGGAPVTQTTSTTSSPAPPAPLPCCSCSAAWNL